MNILEKAAELAAALEGSDEVKQVRETEKIVQADKQAVELMNKFQAKQMEVYNIQMAGKDPSEEISQELNQLRDRIQKNNKLMDYIQAQEKLGKILEQVNVLISKALQGDSCGDNCCSGCAGCS